ncbi:alpha/beta fold hydrolase [Parasediminibacterium paludis]|uniref:Alpha/beta fold hydrolase n=1 Tax=Parasediminibacterium paludis TaxID=908966 RepID=A0ABV8PTY9_9BACT
MHQNSNPCLLSYNIYKKPKTTQWVTFIHGAGGSSIIWYKQIKAFHEHYNILLIDLRGHGNSKQQPTTDTLSFNEVVEDIINVINYLNIPTSHFVGISLGTIIIRQLADMHPSRVYSLTMAGAIMRLNVRSQILMRFGMLSKSLIPYMWLYRFFAFIIMPRKNHKTSRQLFIREAKKLSQQEFIRWFRLSVQVNPLLRKLRTAKNAIPMLYLMGSEDAMFLPSIQKLVLQNPSNSCLMIAANCGHVVNIDNPDFFNEQCISFIGSVIKYGTASLS